MTDHSPVLREHGYHELRVKDVVRETHDASSFVLDVPDELRATFRYRPGQFCTFRVQVDGDEQLRSYSMSSEPGTDRDLTVTVKRVAGGLVSNWFLDRLGVGDVVEVTKPAGVFCPQDAADRPVLGFLRRERDHAGHVHHQARARGHGSRRSASSTPTATATR